jgi:hypothetical protein
MGGNINTQTYLGVPQVWESTQSIGHLGSKDQSDHGKRALHNSAHSKITWEKVLRGCEPLRGLRVVANAKMSMEPSETVDLEAGSNDRDHACSNGYQS